MPAVATLAARVCIPPVAAVYSVLRARPVQLVLLLARSVLVGNTVIPDPTRVDRALRVNTVPLALAGVPCVLRVSTVERHRRLAHLVPRVNITRCRAVHVPSYKADVMAPRLVSVWRVR